MCEHAEWFIVGHGDIYKGTKFHLVGPNSHLQLMNTNSVNQYSPTFLSPGTGFGRKMVFHGLGERHGFTRNFTRLLAHPPVCCLHNPFPNKQWTTNGPWPGGWGPLAVNHKGCTIIYPSFSHLWKCEEIFMWEEIYLHNNLMRLNKWF